MKNILSYDQLNEGSFFSRIFGNPTVDDAALSARKAKGWSQTGRGEGGENIYVVYNGQKFYPDQIEHDDYNSTKPIPRVENGKLIIANPAWSL